MRPFLFKVSFMNIGMTLCMDHSQYGQSAWIQSLAEGLGITEGTLFEAGAHQPNRISNSRSFLESGWKALLVEASTDNCLKWEKFNHPKASIFNEKISYKHGGLDKILERVDSPFDIDVLFLDIDGAEYQLLHNMSLYRPKIICVEYDNSYPLSIDFVPKFSWNSIESGQCSSTAMYRMMSSKGYIYVNSFFIDHVFISQELLSKFRNLPGYDSWGQKAFSRIAPKNLYQFNRVLLNQPPGKGGKGIEFYQSKLNNLVVNQYYRDASHYFYFLSQFFESFSPFVSYARGKEYFDDYVKQLDSFNNEYADSLFFL